jgi:diacylglycerol kinase (ATP)
MVSIAVQALAGSDCALAVVPAGTGNDFARTLGVPLHDPAAAAEVIADGTVGSVDLGRTGDRWFGTVLTSGFDSKVTARAHGMRRPRGRMRYNLAVVRELMALRPLDYTLTLDGREFTTRAVLVAVGNTSSYGGGMRVCPGARPDDGMLSVTVIGPVDRTTLVRVFPRVYKGQHIHHPAVRTHQAREARLAANGITAYADGEFVGPLPLTVRVAPAALRVVLPAR